MDPSPLRPGALLIPAGYTIRGYPFSGLLKTEMTLKLCPLLSCHTPTSIILLFNVI